MATILKRDLAETMRWLWANGIRHEAIDIVDGSLVCVNNVIQYDTLLRTEGGRIQRVPHRVKQTVTHQQANDA